MHFKALVSAIALGAAVSLSGPVSAQEVMINGVVVPPDELAAVQARCDELAEAAENESLSDTTGDEDDDGDDTDAGTDDGTDDGTEDGTDDGTDDGADDGTDDNGDTVDSAGEADATIDDAPEVNEVENATTVIDLDTITLQACIDAGLVEDTAM